MIAALYIRVSTNDQLEYSPDAQKRALTEYAKKNGYFVDDQYIFVDEGISGTTAKKRPAFMNMIALAKKKPKPFDVILVHKFDRFSRSREDSIVYKSLLRKECGIKVISITEQMEDDKFSVILEAMLEAMSEYYSLNLSDEVMKGMTEKARRGEVQAKPTFGYDIVDNKRIINEKEAEIVRKIYKLCIEGNSIGQIAKQLNQAGYRNKQGNPFNARHLKYTIENPVYRGANAWNRTNQTGGKYYQKPEDEWIIVENTHAPIVSTETWEQAQVELRKWHRDVKPRSAGYKHWLGGLLRCANCGSTLVYHSATTKRKDGSVNINYGYQCAKFKVKTCTTSQYINVKNIEAAVFELLEQSLEVINKTGSLDALNVESTENSENLDVYESQLKRLNYKLELAKDAYLNEVDTLEEYKKNKLSIQAEIEKIEALISTAKSTRHDPTELTNKITTALSMLQDKTIDVMQKNKFLKSFIKDIIYDKANDSLTVDFRI